MKWLTLILLLAFSALTDAHTTPPRSVLFIHSYLPGEWVHGINKTFETALERAGIPIRAATYIFHSAHWFETPKAVQSEERKRILSFVQETKPDLVILCDDEANDFISASLQEQGWPILFTGVNQALEKKVWASKPGVSGVLERYPFGKTMEALRKLAPAVRSLSILSSNTPTSQIVTSQLEKWFKENGPALSFQLRKTYLVRYWREWKSAAQEINRKDGAVWILVPYDILDENNEEMNIEKMGDWMAAHFSIPSLGIISIHTRIGLLAAIHTGPEALGRQTAEQAIRFFKGTPLKEIGVEESKYHRFEINSEAADRLKLKIPADLLDSATLVKRKALRYGR